MLEAPERVPPLDGETAKGGSVVAAYRGTLIRETELHNCESRSASSIDGTLLHA